MSEKKDNKIESTYEKRKKAHRKRTKEVALQEPKELKDNNRQQLIYFSNKKTRKNKIVILLFIALLIISIGIALSLFIIEDKKQKELTRQKNIKNEITSKYSQYVETTSKTTIYELKENEYIEIGTLGEKVNIELEDMDITYQTQYFNIKGTNYYIEYQNVLPSEKKEVNNRYKSFIVFNKNIITKDITSFYNESDNLYIKINKSYNLPIIINDKNKYGVEFDNQLLYVKKEDIKEIKNATNTKEETRTNIRTLTYHTVYKKGEQECNNFYVCHPTSQFEEHMKYIHDKKYLTLTMEELEMFLDGKIRIPKKSIVITLDDGRRLNNSVPIIEKYNIYATFFIITSKYSIENYKDSKYAKFESHTDDLHHNYKCSGGYYGSQVLCEDYDKLIKDLKLSQEKVGGSKYFAYPFFDSNARAIKALKETGFKLAFIGEYDSNGFSTPQTDRYQLRRKTVFGNDNLSVLKSYLP